MPAARSAAAPFFVTLAVAIAVLALAALAPAAHAAPAAGAFAATAGGHAATPGARQWVRTYGPPTSVAYYTDLAVGRDGRVYCVGSVSKLGKADLVVTCYDSSGTRVWARRWDQHPIQWGVRIAVSATGAVYVAGAVSESPGVSEIVLLRYSPAGKLLWVRQYAGPSAGEDVPYALVADSSGNAYMLSRGLDAAGTHAGAVVLKWSAAGDLRWVRRLEPHPTDPVGTHIIPADLALDGLRDVYVAVNLMFPAAQPLGSLVKLSGDDGAELARSGGLIVLGTGSEYTSLAVRGSAVVVGGWYHPWDAPAYLQRSMLVARHDLDLTLRWVVTDKGSSAELNSCDDVAVDAAGGVYAAGTTNDQGGAGTSTSRATLLRVSPDGLLSWKQTLVPGLKEQSRGSRVAVSGGDVYLAGVSTGDTEKEDFLVAGYSTAGTPEWTAAWKSKGHGEDWPMAMAAVRGSLYVAGFSGGSLRQAVLIRYAR